VVVGAAVVLVVAAAAATSSSAGWSAGTVHIGSPPTLCTQAYAVATLVSAPIRIPPTAQRLGIGRG
jgi:hypothetical protein